MIKIFGDSHSRVFKKIKINNYKIDCTSISGGTISGLPKRISTLQIRNKIIEYLEKNNPNILILKFGQVDIDLRYYYKLITSDKVIDKNIYIDDIILKYQQFINIILKYIDINKIIIYGINPPALKSKKSFYIYTKRIISYNGYEKLYNNIETIQERTRFSKLFNNKLKKLCIINKIKYQEVFDELLGPDKIISDFYTNDNDHHLKGIENDNSNFEPINNIFRNSLSIIYNDT